MNSTRSTRRDRLIATLLLATMLASGCAIGGGSFCRIAEPILVSDADLTCMTVETAESILGHNLRGRKLCGW
jgi:hypothetical protein